MKVTWEGVRHQDEMGVALYAAPYVPTPIFERGDPGHMEGESARVLVTPNFGRNKEAQKSEKRREVNLWTCLYF